jgi:hypothetical protein
MPRRPSEKDHSPETEAPKQPGRREFLAAAAAVVAVPVLAGCDTDAPVEPRMVTASAPRAQLAGSKEPWWTLHKKLAASIGAAKNVSVPALERVTGGYLQRVVTDDDRTGTGLATVLQSSHTFDTVKVTVVVQNSYGKRWSPRTVYKQSDLVYAMKDALATNVCSCGVLRDSLDPSRPVVAIFGPCVVKFFDSVKSDYYGNFQQVAACAFCDLFNSTVGGFKVTATTRDLSHC